MHETLGHCAKGIPSNTLCIYDAAEFRNSEIRGNDTRRVSLVIMAIDKKSIFFFFFFTFLYYF